jgi:GNAT superfamily N-acetyltransferase
MILTVNDVDVDVRPGTAADVPLLLSLIRSMAEFERLGVTATEQSLQDALFGDAPAARPLLLFVEGKPIGYMVYFFSFSTMAGKRCLWLEDLFIAPAFRGKGIGRALMSYLAGVAIEHDCGRFEWIVLDWNDSAIEFYKGLGARVLDDWRVCRLDEEQLPSLARRPAS